MLASCHFLLPSLDLLLPSKGVGLENSINNFRQLARLLIHIVDATFVALDLRSGIVAVGFRLGRNGELGDLVRRLVAFDLLARALDVQDKGMIRGGDVED